MPTPSRIGLRDMLGGVLLVVFVGFTLLQARSRENSQTNEKVLQSLAKETLTEAKADAGDWPTWRGPRRDGISQDIINIAWPETGPNKLWEQLTGEGYASVAVAGDKVFTFFQDKNDETCVAFDRRTGREKWRFGYPAFYPNPYGNGPRATPTIDGERVYTIGGTGLLHCLDAKTGLKLWEKDLLDEYKAPTPKWGISFSPLIEGDMIILHPGGTEGCVVALDKRSGKLLWKSLSDGGGYSSPIAADIEGQRQIVVFTAAGPVGLEPTQGKLLWRFDWKTPWDCNIATPIIAGSYVFITSGYDRGCALIKISKAGDAWTADRVYENTKLCSHFASCVRFGEVVYGFNESTLVGLELRTGKILWKQRGFGKGSVLGVGERLLVMGETGTCALADVSAKGYHELARFTFSQERCWTVPVLAHGLLYLRDQKTLACYDVQPSSSESRP